MKMKTERQYKIEYIRDFLCWVLTHKLMASQIVMAVVIWKTATLFYIEEELDKGSFWFLSDE